MLGNTESKTILVEYKAQPSTIQGHKQVAPVLTSNEPSWMDPIRDFLRENILPSDSREARKIKMKERILNLLGDELYRRSFGRPHLRLSGALIFRFFEYK